MRETATHYFFYKHEFSQWTKRPMVDKNGLVYNCAEQYMMYQKAILFNDIESANKIMNSSNPREHKNIGRLVKGYDQEIWDNHKLIFVCDGNILKFSQHQDLKNKLINTTPKILVEASPTDCIWGVGLSENDDKIIDEINWRGKNLLGKALMFVREVLNRGDFDVPKEIRENNSPKQST